VESKTKRKKGGPARQSRIKLFLREKQKKGPIFFSGLGDGGQWCTEGKKIFRDQNKRQKKNINEQGGELDFHAYPHTLSNVRTKISYKRGEPKTEVPGQRIGLQGPVQKLPMKKYI